MILGPMEIAFIVGIGLLLLGPDKVPQLGRALGNAMKEYQDAMKGLKDATNSPRQITNQLMDSMSKPTNEDEKLIQSAKQLGIETEGKTVEQISKEILEKF